MIDKHLRTLEHAKRVNNIQKNINFYKDMINKCELEKQRAISGAGLKSLSLDRAIKHLEKLHERLSEAMQRSVEYHDDGHPEEFTNYLRIAEWKESTERQLKAAQKSQRKKVNIFEFSYELIDAIKDRVSITDMLDELKIKKRRSGGNRYVVICPFHDEKTPSCMIYAEDDRFHCFGCQADGDAIDFYQQYSDIEFDEALARLCDRLQIQVMDADQVEAVDKKIADYKRFLESCEEDLREENNNYAKEINYANNH